MTYPRSALRNLLRALAVCVWLLGHAPGASAAPLPAQAAAQVEQVAQLIAEAVAAFERNDKATARNLFRRAVQLDKRNVTAHTYLGALADQAGALAEAERHFAAAAAAAPSSPAARNNYGAVLLRMGLKAQAAAQFEASLKLDGNQASALVNLAQIRFAGGTAEDLRQARALFEKARSVAPDAEIARALLIIALRLKETAAAASSYREYAAHLPTATAETRAPSARGELGAALLEAGLHDEAAEELNAALQSDPANLDVILRLARAHLARKDIPAAGRTLEGAVSRGVAAAPVYAALAEVYERSGHVENAIPAMRLAIERDPANEAYRFRYAMLLTDTKAPAAAVIRLREALKQFPASARLWFALGVAHFADRKHDDAAKALTRSMELDPRFAPAPAYLGMIYAEQGQYAEAVRRYEKALEANGGIAAVHYLLADAILKQPSGDAARAEQHLMRAVALDQSLTPARLALAKLLLRTDRAAEASRQLEQLIAAEPGLAEAHYQLGRAYQRLRRVKEAEAAFATFKRLGESEERQAMAHQREVARRLAHVMF